MLRPLRSNPSRARVSVGKSVPAPIEGWDAVSPIAKMKPERAIVLDNWFPQPGYVEVRRGSDIHGSGVGSGVVDTLMVYNGLSAGSNKMFAVGTNAIYDVTSEGATAITTETGLATNRWQYVNYTTSGGTHYLWCCSGLDAPRHYNGSVWAQPSITGISATDIINVNVHKKRIWGILANSMDACYLPLDSIAGAATKFPLGSVMAKGGYLVAMATWTLDAGAGIDDYAVYISSRGQVAVYQGTDPSSDFALVGVYDVGAPLGTRCFTKVAGDIALVNIDGVLPLSKALGVDQGAAATVAITQRINNAMNTAARNYRTNFGWELTSYAKGTMALLNVPIIEGEEQHQYVMNTLTGAWCRFKGWNANCFRVFNDNLYFGGNSGIVYLADTGAMDGPETIEAIGKTAYNYFGTPGSNKKFGALQPIITTDSAVAPSIGVSTDFKDNATLGTPASAAIGTAQWDSAIYDTDVYPVESSTVADWTTVSGIGQCAAIHFRVKTGLETNLSVWGEGMWDVDVWSATPPAAVTLQLNGFNITYEGGEFL
jgi:hypothetical protein